MEGKITDSLKPPLTKRPSKVGYWKLNEMTGSSDCLIQKHQFVNFWGKTIWGKYGKTSKAKMGEEGMKSMKSHTQKWGYYQWLRVASFELWDLNFEQVKFGLW